MSQVRVLLVKKSCCKNIDYNGALKTAKPLENQGVSGGLLFCNPIMAPQTGLEPVTPRLTAACSTD